MHRFLFCFFIRIINLDFQFCQISRSVIICFSNILTLFNIFKCLILEIDSIITILPALFLNYSIIRFIIFIKCWDLIIILISIVLILTFYSKIIILTSCHLTGLVRTIFLFIISINIHRWLSIPCFILIIHISSLSKEVIRDI